MAKVEFTETNDKSFLDESKHTIHSGHDVLEFHCLAGTCVGVTVIIVMKIHVHRIVYANK